MKRAKKQIFQNFAAAKGLKSTRQRDIILDGFLASDRHLSIEELYLKLRTSIPTSVMPRSTGLSSCLPNRGLPGRSSSATARPVMSM